jgi:hypothetical protein
MTGPHWPPILLLSQRAAGYRRRILFGLHWRRLRAVYLTDMASFGEMNEAYLAVFGADPPARQQDGGRRIRSCVPGFELCAQGGAAGPARGQRCRPPR